ncbi:hypothetical protein P9314_14975 [Paenibacillus validus]|uniref:Uncharacterized protein n=1 Tax=Paenibacillus validus TaxID=44253 RepID=A0A7X2ZC64_9BACL|nr:MULTISPECIES: hypothetical protein [Paenibacillus]MED4601998.1 hypothetical protein [Paenibacillus validus]MED4608005.1 hypothetical protein [Paenibacillus validus]MUG71570.1 hypothetical protein [Paenibacillus validus]
MRNRNNTIAYILFGLLAIGILATVFSNPGAVLLPVLVFGVIFFLYRYPPNTWKRPNRSAPTGRFQRGKRKKANFRVIPGSKDSNDDEPPKYH